MAADEGGLAIARHAGPDDIVAVRAGRGISRARFGADVMALAGRLPRHAYMLNACADRYRFMVGFAAALVRRQISLMTPGEAPWVLRALADDYPDMYALTDGGQPPVPAFVYPDDLDGDDGASVGARAAMTALPAIPGAQPALVLFTSGSTGRPNAVPKSWGALVRSARAAGERLGISGLGRATLIGTVPHQHSYGIESIIMLALQHGLAVDAVCPRYPADIRAAIARASRPRVLVTAPLHILALLAEPADMPGVDLVMSATAPLPAARAVQAEECFAAPLIEIYGCTEAGQLASRRTAREAAWHCLEGVDVRQDGQASWASGAAVEGTALLHDRIELAGAGRFLLGDRSADLVDVAGKRTSLAHLNHQLLSIAGVRDGAFVMAPTDGARVPRLMALAVAPELRSEAILRALRERIDAVFLPRPLFLVEALPRNALGKLPRAELLRLASRGSGG